MISFASKEREAFSGLLLAIIRSQKGKPGKIKLTASSEGIQGATIIIDSK
jgi:beta-galactosidase